MKRIMIIGACGAGKSTFAKKLQQITRLPLHHLDQMFWLPSWQHRDKQEFRENVAHLARSNEWIIDGRKF